MRYFVFVMVAACFMTQQHRLHAQDLEITVENLQTPGGYYFTPVWFGLHDGTFDHFDTGSTSSASLEALAEGGDTSGIMTDFTTAGFSEQGVVTAPAGFAGAPVFDPLDSGTIILGASSSFRYLSYGSMLIPSNDVFFGNNDPVAHEIFDALGNFNGPITIDIFGANLYDAGTEQLDASTAAFIGGGGTDEGGVITLLSGTSLDDFNTEFNGQTTAAGTTISQNLTAGSPIARITITQSVPEPGSAALLGMIAIGAVCRVRRKRK